jgi:hypothetical protein
MSHLPAPPRSPVQMWFPAAGLKCGIAGPNEGHAMLAPFFLHVNSLQVAPGRKLPGTLLYLVTDADGCPKIQIPTASPLCSSAGEDGTASSP